MLGWFWQARAFYLRRWRKEPWDFDDWSDESGPEDLDENGEWDEPTVE